jgi:hypothetical protein
VRAQRKTAPGWPTLATHLHGSGAGAASCRAATAGEGDAVQPAGGAAGVSTGGAGAGVSAVASGIGVALALGPADAGTAVGWSGWSKHFIAFATFGGMFAFWMPGQTIFLHTHTL